MKSLEELKAIREKMQGQLGLREEENAKTRVLVGMATCGIAAGARPVLTEISDEVQKDHGKDRFEIPGMSCGNLSDDCVRFHGNHQPFIHPESSEGNRAFYHGYPWNGSSLWPMP